MHWIRNLALAAAVFVCAGCAWEVVPPSVSAGVEPATVFVTDYGRHTRLGLPAGERVVVEWGFGDWDYYALEKTGPMASLRAISPFGSSTLARRDLLRVSDVRGFQSAAGGVRTVAFVVEREKADALLADLESRWRCGREVGAARRETEGLEFALDEERYHLLRNSNSKTAVWLRELGCEVSGMPILSNFRVRGQ